MRIGLIHIKNIKAAREIRVYGADLMQLAGPNGSGKSSFWDGFQYALCGKDAIGELPLRRGKKKAEATVYLVYDENAENFNPVDAEETADLIVARRFNKENQLKGGTLTIKARDGSKWGQKMLDKIYDATMFSPPDIATRLPGEAKDKFEKRVAGAFQELAGPEFVAKLKEKDAEVKAAGEERTLANRELGRFGTVERLEKVEEVDTGALDAEISAVRAWNDEMDERVTEQASTMSLIDAKVAVLKELRGQEGELERQLSELQQKIHGCLAYKTDLTEQYAALPAPEPRKDLAEIEKARTKAGAVNEQHAAYQRNLTKIAEHRGVARAANDAEEMVERVRDERQELIDGVDLAVPELKWDGTSTTFDGLPWSELSTGERWMVAIKIVIAREALMAKGRRLKVILIRQASLIDKVNFPKIVKFANSKGWQIAAEAVDPRGGDVLMIEDGEPRDIEF